MPSVVEFQPQSRMSNAPQDIEAEFSLLGILLFNNQSLELIPDELNPDHFYEPTNGRIFETIRKKIHAGAMADPITVASAMLHDEAFGQLGGRNLLADLLCKAAPAANGPDYAKIIIENWRLREIIRLGDYLTKSARSGGDAADLIFNSEKTLTDLNNSVSTARLVSAEEAVQRVQAQLENPERASGVRTGLAPVDDVTGGFMPGELWLIAGRPGMGKSAIANSTALHIARHGMSPDGERLGVIEIGSEMTVEQMMRRHICDMAFELYGVNAPTYSQVRKRLMTPAQRDAFNGAARELSKLGTLYSIYRTGLTVPALRAMIRKQASAWRRRGIKIGLVTVDHVGLLRASAATRGRTEAQGEIAREMKEICGELEIPILALVQLNRQVESRDDKRPMLSDLRDSGEWEENADGVLGAYRDAYYAKREGEPKGYDKKAEWEARCESKHVDAIFMKIREGEMQTVKLWADMGRNAIRGSAPERYYDQDAFL